MTQADFNALWTLDEIPACDVGMVLLKAWADATPSGLTLVMDTWPLDALGNVPGGAVREWELFSEHWNACDSCKGSPHQTSKIVR